MEPTLDADDGKPAVLGRREMLVAGAGMAVVPLLAGVASGAQATANAAPGGNGPV